MQTSTALRPLAPHVYRAQFPYTTNIYVFHLHNSQVYLRLQQIGADLSSISFIGADPHGNAALVFPLGFSLLDAANQQAVFLDNQFLLQAHTSYELRFERHVVLKVQACLSQRVFCSAFVQRVNREGEEKTTESGKMKKQIQHKS